MEVSNWPELAGAGDRALLRTTELVGSLAARAAYAAALAEYRGGRGAGAGGARCEGSRDAGGMGGWP